MSRMPSFVLMQLVQRLKERSEDEAGLSKSDGIFFFVGGGGGHVRIECCNGLQDLFATFKMPSPQISN